MGRGVRGRRGGILRLWGLIRTHPEAVAYDLIRHGRHIDDLGTTALSWRDLKVILDMQPPGESATFRALYPDEYDRDKTLERLEMLAVILVRSQMLTGKQSEVKESDLPVTWDDLFEKAPDLAGDRPHLELLTFDEIDARMGWAN